MPTILRLETWEIVENRPALTEEDRCYYYMTYYPFSELAVSGEKQTILNLKISKEELQENPKRNYWKEKSLREIANLLINTIKHNPVLTDYLWVPAQSSKTKSDPNYDDRLQQILIRVKQEIPSFKWFDALSVKKTVEKSRQSNQRNVQEKLENLHIDPKFVDALSQNKVVVFDDVLTTGATFKAAQLKIKAANPTIEVIGIFIAKAVSLNNR
ncbi:MULTISPECIES: phosphoribosyltransferase [Legionella]|uniref:phosphoribosyltransferase n=1 Tax=Legionella TaxID=445 RepID=UPI001041B173|nr:MULTISPECIES: phosphoribosyltransferase [Legionella]